MKAKNVKEKIVKLLIANPELPIVAMVNWDVVGSDEFSWWYGNVADVDIEEVVDNGKYYEWTRSEAEDFPAEFYELYGDGKITDDKDKKQAGMELIAKWPWTRVIAVHINNTDD